jgi:hypothetical protein
MTDYTTYSSQTLGLSLTDGLTTLILPELQQLRVTSVGGVILNCPKLKELDLLYYQSRNNQPPEVSPCPLEVLKLERAKIEWNNFLSLRVLHLRYNR